jgi:16S rRNA processing protein RimM
MNPMAFRYQILLGRISKVSGYSGSVSVKLERSFYNNIPEMESVFLEIDGKQVPFFISSSEYSGGDLLKLKFEGYGSCEKVSEFTGCRIFLTTVSEETASTSAPESLSGFKVILKNKDLIGTVKETIQNPGQDLLNIVSPEGKEILIPFHEAFILKIEVKNETILVELPEGLTDIN